jgi:CHAT domain-containing protein
VTNILFLAANPAATPRLALEEEACRIGQELQMARFRSGFAVHALWAPRPLDLLRGLNEVRPTIVHFAGHGLASEGIVLPDGRGGEVVVAGDALRKLFEAFPHTVRLVVLNACSSREQCEEVKEAIGCAIGMNAAMGDVAARRFAEALYGALGAGWHWRDGGCGSNRGLTPSRGARP